MNTVHGAQTQAHIYAVEDTYLIPLDVISRRAHQRRAHQRRRVSLDLIPFHVHVGLVCVVLISPWTKPRGKHVGCSRLCVCVYVYVYVYVYVNVDVQLAHAMM